MKKRTMKFAAILLAAVILLAVASTVGAAAARYDHKTSAASHYAEGQASSKACHTKMVSTYVIVRCNTYPITNPSSTAIQTAEDWGDFEALARLSNPNYGYVASTAMHACYGKCDGCNTIWGNYKSNYHR